MFKFYKKETTADELREAEYYSFEREYSVNVSKNNDIFNRYLIFLNKEDNKANFIPISSKMFLKKFKKPVKEDEVQIYKEEDILLVPRNYSVDEINHKIKLYKKKRFNIDVESQDFEVDVNKVFEELESKKQVDQVMEEAVNDDEDLFKESDNEDST
jgi:predicted nucleotidyltransferase